jgi:predicted ATPase
MAMESIPPFEDALESPVPLPTRLITTSVVAKGLPKPLTTFVGRDREVEAVWSLLLRPDVRILTLTGPGGVGKTRLALRVSEGLADTFIDGVAYVQLASVSDPDLVLVALAQAVGVRDNGAQPVVDRLRAHLVTKQLLVILDNFEHVLPASSTLIELLETCDRLTILVTSRARLGVSGEHLYPVAPLTLAETRRSPSA